MILRAEMDLVFSWLLVFCPVGVCVWVSVVLVIFVVLCLFALVFCVGLVILFDVLAALATLCW